MKLFATGVAFALILASSARAEKLSKEDRDRAIKYLETTKQAVIDATKPWLIFCGAHSERHTKQINEVKGNAKFPSA